MTTTTYKNTLERVIDTFEWRHHGTNGDTRGEVSPQEDGLTLELVVWCHNNDAPEDENIHPLEISRRLDPTDLCFRDEDAARRAIRSLIHWYLCHEADEQMFFDNVCSFYPHDETGATIGV